MFCNSGKAIIDHHFPKGLGEIVSNIRNKEIILGIQFTHKYIFFRKKSAACSLLTLVTTFDKNSKLNKRTLLLLN
jgi:hypothetical protein